MRHDRPWKTPTLIVAVLDLLIGGLTLLGPWCRGWRPMPAFWPIWSLIICVTFFVALLRDIASGDRRDWIHWLGAAVFVIDGATNLATWAVFAFLRAQS